MKLGCLVTNDNKINPKTSKRLSTGGCCRRRRKLTMSTNRGMAAPRGWFGIVRKKFLVKTKLKSHNKNIIIIHNNTSIACNEEDNRASSCVEPSKDQTAAAAVLTKNKDGGQETQDQKKKKKPDAGDLDNKTSMIKTTNESGDQENGLKDQKEKPDDGVVEGDSSIVTNKDVGQEVQDFKKKPDTGVIEDKSSTIASTNVGGAQENGLKEHNKKPDDVGVEDDSSMMTMKNEGGKDDQKNSDDNVNNVEGKLILRNEDTEADPSALAAAQAALSVDSGKIKEERRDEQVVHSDVEKAMAAIRIQTTFRGHLARRAFRALKGLVRLQAVVRGVVVRRQARMALHCMRALVRLGDRVRARQLLSRSSDE